ncbi:MAG: ABC transporter ATP-binding protein [Ruminococcus sp.]|nr:ABC transporter ATP-binding protein [Ruminococcus sp.]
MPKGTKKRINLIRDFKNNKENLFWLVKQSKGFYRYILGFLLINFVAMVLTLISSFAGKFVVDAASQFDAEVFWYYIIVMTVTTLLTIGFSFITTLFTSYVGEKYAFTIRGEMFDRVQRSRWYEISKFHSADVLSRLTGDISTVAGAIITIIPTVVIAFVEFIVVLSILLVSDPVMAFIGLVVGPLGMLAATVFRRKFVKYQKALRESESEYYSFFQETLSNLSVVKTFRAEDRNNEYFSSLRKRRLGLIMNSARLSSWMSVVLKVIYKLGYIAAFSWCAYRLTKGDDSYTYGTMTLFLSLVGILQNTISNMGTIIPQGFSAVVAAKRIRAIADIGSEEYGEVGDVPAAVGLKVENLTFSYEDREILRNVNAEIKAKSRVGVVGASGAGKTTFIRLMLNLVSPDSGELKYITDGGVCESASVSTRRFVSYVPQGNTLMSGTVRSNLLLAAEDATDDEMWRALYLADAEDFLRKIPSGLDTEVSEKAGGLSEGQAQRIAIARALLRKCPVLIFDEATSALDEETERRIFERVVKEADATCFIITHRKSMLRYCDTVMEILADGSVITRKQKEE